MNPYVRIVVGALYILCGIAVIFINISPGVWDDRLQEMTGIVMIFYGTYRIVHTHYLKNTLSNPSPDEYEKTER
jgi:hypothetical protein